MPTIYLVRHGENPANLTRQFSCRLIDYSLTPRGLQQAEQTALYFQSLPIGTVFASPLKRAVETATIIAQPLGLEVQVLEQFREVNVGPLEEQPPTAENWAFHDRIFADWLSGKHEVMFPGGENYLTLLARMQAGLKEVIRRNPDKPSVVVGHGGIFMATITNLCRNADMQLIRKGSRNCSVTEIEVELRGDALEAHLQRWGDYGHLTE
jgi:broad specificity phosphatase PhoE